MCAVNDLQLANEVARQIVQKELGESVTHIAPLTGGVVNLVFAAVSRRTETVVRMNHDSLGVYRKEEWAMEQAARAGVNVPMLYAVGSYEGFDYMLMSMVPGSLLSEYGGELEPVVHELGRQARLLNDIAVDGFGFDLDISNGPAKFGQSWQQLVCGEQDFIFNSDALCKMGALTRQQIEWCRDFLRPLREISPQAYLCHGDLHGGNVIVTADAQPVVVDWTLCKGGWAPMFDLSRFAATSPEHLNSFLSGYGLSQGKYSLLSTDLRRIDLTDTLRAAVWAFGEGHAELHKFVADVHRAVQQSMAI